MRGSETEMFGLTFPMFKTISSDGGLFGNGSARAALNFVGFTIVASTVVTLIQEQR